MEEAIPAALLCSSTCWKLWLLRLQFLHKISVIPLKVPKSSGGAGSRTQVPADLRLLPPRRDGSPQSFGRRTHYLTAQSALKRLQLGEAEQSGTAPSVLQP